MTGAALAPDLFTRPLADLDDVERRIGAAVSFIADLAAGRAVPSTLQAELGYARATLADLAAIKRPAARAKAFRLEHGVETLKDLHFAILDHAAFLGLRVASAEAAA